MALPISKEERKELETMRSFSHISEITIQEIWEYVLYKIVDDYVNNKSTILPYIGTLKLEYDGDERIDGINQAKLLPIFEISKNLKLIIGNVEDGEVSALTHLWEEKIQNELGGKLL